VTVVTADPLLAIRAYLQASAVGALLEPREHGPAIYRPTMPPTAQDDMPFGCIVIRPAGGYNMFGIGLLPVADPKIDFTCYAGTPQESYEIAVATARALKQLQMSIWEGTKLYWARVAGGPIPLPDQNTMWPATWLSAQVMHAEIAADGNQED
jgi:hypothetical protein